MSRLDGHEALITELNHRVRGRARGDIAHQKRPLVARAAMRQRAGVTSVDEDQCFDRGQIYVRGCVFNVEGGSDIRGDRGAPEETMLKKLL